MGTQVIGTLPIVRGWKDSSGKLIEPGTLELLPLPNGTANGIAKHSRNGSDGYKKTVGVDEAIRSIRESILLNDLDRPIRTVLITSPSPKEGKSTFAVNLALANAKQNKKTLLIDADLRRPSAHTRLGLENTAGMADVIRQERDWRDGADRSGGSLPGFPPRGPASRNELLDPVLGTGEVIAVEDLDVVAGQQGDGRPSSRR